MTIKSVSFIALLGSQALVVVGGAVVFVMSACSSENVFEVLEQPDEKAKGESSLARGDHDEAIEYLEAAYAENPDDPEVRKMLANAYMSKAGVDTLEIIQTIAEGQEGTDWSTLVNALPESNSENLESLARSVELLNQIPEEQRSDEDRYQLAMAQTSLAVVTAKKYGVDMDGNVSAEQAEQITDLDAELIVDQLSGAASNLGALDDEGAEKGAQKIQGVSTKIEESAGDTPSDKLRAFLQKK